MAYLHFMCNNDKVHNPKKRSTYRAIFVWLQTGIFFISALAAPRIALLAQADTEFWFVAPEVAGINGEDPLVLMIGSVGMPAEVSIDLPADPGFVPLSHSLAALEVRIVDLSPWRDRLENGPANTVLNKGLRITATTPINSYYSIASDNNADIFALKGRQALGRAFFIPAQTDFINVGGRSGFDVVATQDGTQVEITPAADIVGHLAGIPFLIQLNRGQSFSCRELGTGPGNHLAGSQVVADRPIAVSISDESIVTSGANGGRDLLGDQLIPVRLLGKEYILMRGEADIERVYVTATVDQTQVQMDGQAAVLQQGETHAFDLAGAAAFLRSTQPVYVLHLSGYGPEPACALIPTLTCTGTRLVKYIRPASENFFVYLLTRTGNENGFLINGAPNIVAANFAPVPGSNNQWKSTRIEAFPSPVTSTNQIHHPQALFHMGLINYSGTGAAYGFFSDFSKLALGELRTFCAGDSLKLDAGPDKTGYLWSTGDTTQAMYVQQPGTYWVRAQFGDCLLSDTVEVERIDPQLDLGGDRAICENDLLQLSLDPGASYRWDDGSTGPLRTIGAAGVYWVEASKNGCVAADTLRLSEIALPPLDLGPDTLLCAGETILLDVSVPGATYRWHNGATDSQFSSGTPGLYWVARSLDGCTQRDTLAVGLRSLVASLGPDTLLCLGDTLRIALDPAGASYLWEDGSTSPFRSLTAGASLQLLAANRCESRTLRRELQFEDCRCAPFVPNVFSPNADGVNDAFLVEFDCPLRSFSLRIFDRWGTQVFETRNPGDAWNGARPNGNFLPAGVYFWAMQYEGEKDRRTGPQVQKGHVLLVR